MKIFVTFVAALFSTISFAGPGTRGGTAKWFCSEILDFYSQENCTKIFDNPEKSFNGRKGDSNKSGALLKVRANYVNYLNSQRSLTPDQKRMVLNQYIMLVEKMMSESTEDFLSNPTINN